MSFKVFFVRLVGMVTKVWLSMPVKESESEGERRETQINKKKNKHYFWNGISVLTLSLPFSLSLLRSFSSVSFSRKSQVLDVLDQKKNGKVWKKIAVAVNAGVRVAKRKKKQRPRGEKERKWWWGRVLQKNKTVKKTSVWKGRMNFQLTCFSFLFSPTLSLFIFPFLLLPFSLSQIFSLNSPAWQVLTCSVKGSVHLPYKML